MARVTFKRDTEVKLIWNVQQGRERTAREMGREVANPVTREQVEAHVDLCAEMEMKYAVTCHPQRHWGKSEDDIRAFALSASRRNAARRGHKTLRERYGDERASQIVFEQSGKRAEFLDRK